jgi:hypothetical protein
MRVLMVFVVMLWKERVVVEKEGTTLKMAGA